MSKTISRLSLVDDIQNFLTSFKQDKEIKYLQKIDRLIESDYIEINSRDFLHDTSGLYDILHESPDEFKTNLKKAIQRIYAEKYPQSKKEVEVLIDESENKISLLESLGSKYVGKLVEIKGVIISNSKIYNQYESLTHICQNNHETITPGNVNIKKCLHTIPNASFKRSVCNSDIIDVKQSNLVRHRILYIKSDEDFSNHNDELKADVQGELTEIATIGDRVRIVGVLKSYPSNKDRSEFNNTLEVFGIKKLDDVDLRINVDDEESFHQYPSESDFYNRLVNSIAPSVLGLQPIKEALLLQRVSSPDIIKKDGTRTRGWLHIGLFGDPGTAKTKLGEWQQENLPRTHLIMSKGATHTGLIMGLEQGADGRKVLKAGALITCRNGGLVCIDEFPRLDPEVIDGLYTTAESGLASISKTGHQDKILANTPILATGNARSGKWVDQFNVPDNLGIEETFLQRFDFIFVLKDNYDSDSDNKLADVILNDMEYSEYSKPFSTKILAKYFKFIQQFRPELTKEVNEHLKKTWLELRKHPQAQTNGISPRHLNTLIRTTLAIARIYQRRYATIEDATKAIDLFRKMFSQQNISIAQADTYLTRSYNKAIAILQQESIEGLTAQDLFDKITQYGTETEQEQARVDLGSSKDIRDNRKWREVIEQLKRSPLINISKEKPLTLNYDKSKGFISNYLPSK